MLFPKSWCDSVRDCVGSPKLPTLSQTPSEGETTHDWWASKPTTLQHRAHRYYRLRVIIQHWLSPDHTVKYLYPRWRKIRGSLRENWAQVSRLQRRGASGSETGRWRASRSTSIHKQKSGEEKGEKHTYSRQIVRGGQSDHNSFIFSGVSRWISDLTSDSGFFVKFLVQTDLNS